MGADSNIIEASGAVLEQAETHGATGPTILRAVVDSAGAVLAGGDFRFLAMANPKLAPYGVAAQQVLRACGAEAGLRGRIVRGENIAQTFQFVQSGNAQLGFVALAQIKRPGDPGAGSSWQIPQALYEPIRQEAVLLRDSVPGRALLEFVRSSGAKTIIRAYGYDIP